MGRVLRVILIGVWIVAAASVPLVFPREAAAQTITLFSSTFNEDCSYGGGVPTGLTWVASEDGASGVCTGGATSGAQVPTVSNNNFTVNAGTAYTVNVRASGSGTLYVDWRDCGLNALDPASSFGNIPSTTTMTDLVLNVTAVPGACRMYLWRTGPIAIDSFSITYEDGQQAGGGFPNGPVETPRPQGSDDALTGPGPYIEDSEGLYVRSSLKWPEGTDARSMTAGGVCPSYGGPGEYDGPYPRFGIAGTSIATWPSPGGDILDEWFSCADGGTLTVGDLTVRSQEWEQHEGSSESWEVGEYTVFVGELFKATSATYSALLKPVQTGCTIDPCDGVMSTGLGTVVFYIVPFKPCTETIGGEEFNAKCSDGQPIMFSPTALNSGDRTGWRGWSSSAGDIATQWHASFGREITGWLLVRGKILDDHAEADCDDGGAGNPNCGTGLYNNYVALPDKGKLGLTPWDQCEQPGCVPDFLAGYTGLSGAFPRDLPDESAEEGRERCEGSTACSAGPETGCPLTGDETKPCSSPAYCDGLDPFPYMGCVMGNIPLLLGNYIIDLFLPGEGLEDALTAFSEEIGGRVPIVWVAELVGFLTGTMTSGNLAGADFGSSFSVFGATVSLPLGDAAAAFADWRWLLAGLVWVALAWGLFRAVGSALGMSRSEGGAVA